MSGPEAKNPAPAGISAPDDLDVADLFEQLREELRRGAGAGGGAESEFAATRALAERFWPVTAEREAGGGPKGLVKRILRKLMRWYVEPLAADQRVYNSSLLKLVDALSERADISAAANERAQQLLRELEERLTRVERRGGSAGVAPAQPVTVAAQPAAAALPDYFAFESRMRGSVEAIRERQRRYVDDLRAAAPVLDVGCGRGELLQLLREAGVEARGIDADADMVAYAQGEGLEVEQADLVEYLERQEDGSLGGVFMGQGVGHPPPRGPLPPPQPAAGKLRGGGAPRPETVQPLPPLPPPPS